MQFNLVFANSGDYIVLDSLQDDVLLYFVDQLNSHGCNSFVSTGNQTDEIRARISSLRRAAQLIHLWPEEIRPAWIKSLDRRECLDQDLLNHLHSAWVQSNTQPWDVRQKKAQYGSSIVDRVFDQLPDDAMIPPFAVVLDKLQLLDLYRQLNVLIHKVESSFDHMRFCQQQQGWIEFDNPFGSSIVSNDIAHVSIAFNHLGRTLYDKWSSFDCELNYPDENTFRELLPFVDVRLVRPQTLGYSSQYLDWCRQHNRQPSGSTVCVGNIPDLASNLTKYREMMLDNLAQGNSFSIQLH